MNKSEIKFRPGDRVVRIIDGYWGLGRKATVLRHSGGYEKDWIVEVEDVAGEAHHWNEDAMELESIYNSPLYKALS